MMASQFEYDLPLAGSEMTFSQWFGEGEGKGGGWRGGGG